MRRFTYLLSSVVILSNLTFNVANADIIDITATSFSQGSTSIDHMINGNPQSVNAGMFNLETSNTPAAFPWLTDGGNVDAFCVELEQNISFNALTEYDIVTGAAYFDVATVDLVGQLFTSAFNSVTDQVDPNDQRVYSSAFQVALWEIVYDSGSIDLSNGIYMTDVMEDADVMAQANTWLSNLGNAVSTFDIFVLKNDDSQDLVIVNPKLAQQVSAPTSLGLMGLAMLGFAVSRRLKKQ